MKIKINNNNITVIYKKKTKTKKKWNRRYWFLLKILHSTNYKM